MNAAELFIECLEAEGVEYIFGIPGEENLAFLEALRTSSIRLVLTRHEQAAGFMAATYGRLTGRPGVCLSTLGPGATNLVTAAAYANLGGMPMVIITGQKPIKYSKQGRFQILDVVRMMEPLTKSSRVIHSGKGLPAMVREGFRLAAMEKPGPVHFELPEDIAAESVTGLPYPRHIPPHPQAAPGAIDEAAHLIREAKRPLLLMAAGANRLDVFRELHDFIDTTGMYFFATQMGKGAVDQRHPRSLGTAALSEHDYLHCAIDRADLILNVGHDVVEKPPFIMGRNDRCTVIHINVFPAQVDDVYFPQLEVIGDVGTTLAALAERVGRCPGCEDEYLARIKDDIDSHVYESRLENSFPPTPQYIVHELRAAIPENGVLSLDNGMYKLWVARNYRAYQPNTVLLDNALATMGAGLPAAIATRLIRPDTPVVALCGDGGFMMNSQELETAVRLGLDLTVVILRDDAYGMIQWKQAGSGLSVYGLEFGNPDFVRYAESYGAKGHRITRSEELRPMLQQCIATPGVHVVEVPVDYSENERVFIEELRSKTCLL